jgi:hypothetical protein
MFSHVSDDRNHLSQSFSFFHLPELIYVFRQTTICESIEVACGAWLYFLPDYAL